MNLNIIKELSIFFVLLLIACLAVVAYNLLKMLTARCCKFAVITCDALIGFGFCIAVFLAIYLLDDGKMRVVYPLLAAVEFYVIAKGFEKIKSLIALRKKKVLDKKSENKIN